MYSTYLPHITNIETIQLEMLPFLKFAIPGLLLGWATDRTTEYLQSNQTLGTAVETYVALETLIILAIKLVFIRLLPRYAFEWQVTLYGIFFVGFFWGMLMTYFINLRTMLSSWTGHLFNSQAMSQPQKDWKA